jgi:hypothetical protein
MSANKTPEETPDEVDVENPPCWCGVKNPHYAPIHGGCGGDGYLDCHCGGDMCVCHNHGEVECFGCPDCQGDNEDDDDCEDGMDIRP